LDFKEDLEPMPIPPVTGSFFNNEHKDFLAKLHCIEDIIFSTCQDNSIQQTGFFSKNAKSSVFDLIDCNVMQENCPTNANHLEF
jgi:hypothetical protein